MNDEELSKLLNFLTEKTSRERSSRTKPDRDAMALAHVDMGNHVEPVPRKGFTRWPNWSAAFDAYCKTSRLAFRVRTFKTVQEYNWMHDVNLDEERFYNSFVNYRCIPSVFQKSRGGGKQHVGPNYTGCRARFDLKGAGISAAREASRHRLVVMNEFHLHNHPSGLHFGVKDFPRTALLRIQ
ncbi:Sedoheptulokinase [Phytophthora megakarya]|uniref:Sedoheptulokinase n=1 Tax=Phytophthora megakarya TaxID=4795 RepID=A0A225WIN5_9STRA|nr:Sedoheptulokinase [Phytophthora megakarya]